MTFFFNLKNVEQEAEGSSSRFLDIIDTVYYKKLPSHRKGVKRVKLDMRGNSFILNLEPVLKLRKNIEIAYIVQYIKLCGMRDYNLYKLYGNKSLLLSYYPDIDIQAIKHNPLLQITQSEIHFKYE